MEMPAARLRNDYAGPNEEGSTAARQARAAAGLTGCFRPRLLGRTAPTFPMASAHDVLLMQIFEGRSQGADAVSGQLA